MIGLDPLVNDRLIVQAGSAYARCTRCDGRVDTDCLVIRCHVVEAFGVRSGPAPCSLYHYHTTHHTRITLQGAIVMKGVATRRGLRQNDNAAPLAPDLMACPRPPAQTQQRETRPEDTPGSPPGAPLLLRLAEPLNAIADQRRRCEALPIRRRRPSFPLAVIVEETAAEAGLAASGTETLLKPLPVA